MCATCKHAHTQKGITKNSDYAEHKFHYLVLFGKIPDTKKIRSSLNIY